MKIKRFFAKDMRTALLQVKEELGAEAVIMSNKKVTGGVEIVAAVDGDTAPAPSQNSRYSNDFAQTQVNSRYASRELQEDRVSLKSNTADNNAQGSMTKRFANMLKQYSQEDTPQSSSAATEADSLASLLKRQSEGRGARTESQRGERGPISSSLTEESGLARLIAEDRDMPRQAPKLDPTRYDKKRGGPIAESESTQELESMREEMNSIRRLLEHQVSGLMWQEVERREPLRAMLIKRLERMGLSSELSDQLACYIPEDTKPAQAWKALLGLISDQIVVTKTDILKKGGVVALLGPTGVGKTTTIAKLAARAAMEYGSDNVALVTTDTYRIGAHEQLAIYGRIMGCPVRVAKDTVELAEVIYQLRNRRLVLVDTAGMGQRDVRLSEQLDTLMQNSGEAISSYLVLPATAQRKVLQETIEHFKRIPLSGCVLTKIDESLSLGEFISVVIENSLPVSYIANGQRVPEDIVIAQPRYMVAKANELLEKSTESEPHYWNSDSEGF
ncbi:flagellar biosynthesis protein FlhF [Vibrio hannami]|uniref:flagellar biosynthesis protein FlhF n=1 Tax=Vibrio hannami TaxID=2717094 RepID=UPI00240EFBBF|nr:flagellar biosynthesis protein FlhF [Vibrio hannami]MDG3088762.1 flagellar biosynthesis protein FlhF [Vibrio hannami]